MAGKSKAQPEVYAGFVKRASTEEGPPWRGKGRIRVVASRGVTPGETATVLVHLEHRDFPGVRFDVELDVRHRVIAVAARPLRWVRETTGPVITYAVADDVPDDAVFLTASMLRTVPWGALAGEAERHARRLGQVFKSAATPAWRKTLDQRRPGRRGRPDRWYAVLANEYVQLRGTGREAEQLAERYHLSPSRVSGLLSEARRREVLEYPPVKGRAGGDLTQYGKSLLEREDDGARS